MMPGLTMMPLLCATVAASSVEELRRLRDEAAARADLVELRLDALRQPDVAGALEGRCGPVVVTCRPRWEGGGFDGSEEARLRVLHEAAERGAEFVDVEWRAHDEPFVGARGGRGIVLSMHDFGATPCDLEARFRAMRAVGAEVVKVAVTAASLADCLRLGELGREARASGTRAALVAMGPQGLVTRILPGRFGSCWTYAGAGMAPGQLSLERMLEEFRFRELTESTTLYGLVGRPLGHSLSPAMHNAAFRACGLDAVYVPLETPDLVDFLAFAERFEVSGASVTAPFKVAAMDRVTAVDAVGRQVGAVNTLRRCQSGREACNTDLAGFLAPLEGERLQGTRAAVIGTGGAARVVVAALAARGASVTVYGRDAERAARVAWLAGGEGTVGLPPRGSWDLLVNATPVGTYPDAGATLLEEADLQGGRLVYDLVYNPQPTRLLREATAAGCRAIGGLEMLVGQAAAQFEWWTGRTAPVAVMREAARGRLARMTGGE